MKMNKYLMKKAPRNMRGLIMIYQISLKYAIGISPLILSKKQSIDIDIYFAGFPIVLAVFEKKLGIFKLNVKIITMTF